MTTLDPGPAAVAPNQGRPGATVISFSELDAGKQCPHKHDLAYKQRWTQPKDERTAAGRGTMWHQIMDVHYTALKNGDVSPRDAVDDQLIDFRKAGKDPEVLDLLAWMYDGYVQKWGHDEEWQVLRVEYKCVVPLRYPDGRLSEFDLKMIIDLVMRSRLNGRVWLWDHKSHAALPKDKDLELDDQFGLYTWGLRQLGHKVHGCIYNTARTKMNIGDKPGAVAAWERAKAAGEKPGQRPKPQSLDDRFDRYLMTRTERETENLAQDALSTARTLYSPYNFGERHTNSDTCKWRCDFEEACLLGRKTDDDRERRFLIDVGFVQNFQRH